MTQGGQRVTSHLGTVVDDAISALKSIDDTDYEDAVSLLEDTYIYEHRVSVIGVGKSAIIAKKIAASFRSFGLPAHAIHATDAVHGDMGGVNHGDTLIVLTHSGTTHEVVTALAALNRKLGGNYGLLVVTSSREAVEALDTDAVLTYSANELHGYAPAASCVAQLVVCDALLADLAYRLDLHHPEMFAVNHPGGSLGESLTADA